MKAITRAVIALAVIALIAATTNVGKAQQAVINFYSDSDTNITDWYSNVIVPAFEKQFPQYKVNVVSTKGVPGGVRSIAERALAAKETGADPQAEVLEFNPVGARDLVEKGVFLKIDETNVPNTKNVIASARLTEFGTAYRGSQVLLAYDSAKIKAEDVPTTFAELIEWTKANPGQFIYCRPDKGGSGGNFVVRAIYEVTGKDPSKFKPGESDAALLAEYPKAWELLREMHPNVYGGGDYPAGNTPVLQLLANGTVSMISAWSDQALQALSNGSLPETVKLAQFTDLAMPGGYAFVAIPANAANLEGAQTFVNFLLSTEMQVSTVETIGGFPAVEWATLPEALQTQYTSVIPSSVPSWPGGAYGAEMVKGWYENVATNIQRDPTATPAPTATPGS
jgi:putative spermidine/putrescine transport system substrate-binding protein